MKKLSISLVALLFAGNVIGQVRNGQEERAPSAADDQARLGSRDVRSPRPRPVERD